MVVAPWVWPVVSGVGGMLGNLFGSRGRRKRIPNIWDVDMGEEGSAMRDRLKIALEGGSMPATWPGGGRVNLPTWGGSTRGHAKLMASTLRDQGQTTGGPNAADAFGGLAQGIGTFGAGGGFGNSNGYAADPDFDNDSTPDFMAGDPDRREMGLGGTITPQKGMQFQAAKLGTSVPAVPPPQRAGPVGRDEMIKKLLAQIIGGGMR